MNHLFKLIALSLVFALAGCSGSPEAKPGNSTSTTTGTPAISNTTAAPEKTPEKLTASGAKRTLTLELYNKLQVGMERSEVERLVGWEGEEAPRPASIDPKISTYHWKGENADAMILVFKDNKLTGKTQVNLK